MRRPWPALGCSVIGEGISECKRLYFTRYFRRLRISLQITPISVTSIRPNSAVPTELDPRENLKYWRLVRKSCRGKSQIWLKSDKNIAHFTWRPKKVSLLPATLTSSDNRSLPYLPNSDERQRVLCIGTCSARTVWGFDVINQLTETINNNEHDTQLQVSTAPTPRRSV